MYLLILVLVLSWLGCPAAAAAADPDLIDGVGAQALALGGVSTVLVDDVFSAANNPAAGALVTPRFALGLEAASTRRSASRTGDAIGASLEGSAQGQVSSGLPAFAIVRRLAPSVAGALAVFGTGAGAPRLSGPPLPAPGACGPATLPGTGFNAGAGPYNLLCGNGSFGLDVERWVAAPALSWRLAPDHALGLALNLVVQRVRAAGLQGLAAFSANAASLAGSQSGASTGIGLRLGYLVRLLPPWSLGLVVAPQTRMNAAPALAGLITPAGRLDLPGRAALGTAWKPTAGSTVALELERVFNGGVAFLGNSSAVAGACYAPAPLVPPATCLGGADGAGLGLHDAWLVRCGLQWRLDSTWQARAGYRQLSQAAPAGPLGLNLAAPLDARRQWSAGASMVLGSREELAVGFASGLPTRVQGSTLFSSLLPAPLGATQEQAEARTWTLQLELAHRF